MTGVVSSNSGCLTAAIILTGRPVGAVLGSLLLPLLEIPLSLLEFALLLLELACSTVVVRDVGLDVLNAAARRGAGRVEAERRGIGLLAKTVVAVRKRIGVECLAVA